MKKLFPKALALAALLFSNAALAAGGSLGGVWLPQNTGAYTIVREGEHYNVSFSIELIIGEDFHQHINEQIAFQIQRRNGGTFQDFETFERYPSTPEDVSDGQLAIRLKLWNVAETDDRLFEFRIHFDLTALSESMSVHVEDGVFSPAVSPTLSIDVTEDPCWTIVCSGERDRCDPATGECVCPEGWEWCEGAERCVEPEVLETFPELCSGDGGPVGGLGPPPPGSGGGTGADDGSSGVSGCFQLSSAASSPAGLCGPILLLLTLGWYRLRRQKHL